MRRDGRAYYLINMDRLKEAMEERLGTDLTWNGLAEEMEISHGTPSKHRTGAVTYSSAITIKRARQMVRKHELGLSPEEYLIRVDPQ